MVVPDPVGCSDGSVLVVLLPCSAVGAGIGGERHRQGEYRIHRAVILSFPEGAADATDHRSRSTDLRGDDGVDMEIEVCRRGTTGRFYDEK